MTEEWPILCPIFGADQFFGRAQFFDREQFLFLLCYSGFVEINTACYREDETGDSHQNKK